MNTTTNNTSSMNLSALGSPRPVAANPQNQQQDQQQYVRLRHETIDASEWDEYDVKVRRSYVFWFVFLVFSDLLIFL